MADVAAEQALQIRLAGPLGFSANDALAWLLAVGFAVFVAGLLAHGSGHIVELAFPAAALLIGAALYFQHPTLYLGFTWWLWFLTPEVRRIVDYQTGWSPISPVMITPYLVAGLACLTLVRCLPQLLRRPALFPFALVLMGLNYGYTIGIVRAGPLAATYGLLTWVVPVVFGFHVAVRWQQYPLYRDAIQRVFLWGVLAMGIYGIVQYFAMPPWDAYWMEAAQMSSLNYWMDRSFSVRVWSTMNSPQPFALTLMAGLLMSFAAKGPLRFIAGVPGCVSFLLSLVRTAWLGWAIGAVFLFFRVRGFQKVRLLAVGILVCLFSLPLLLHERLAETVSKRFVSMQELQVDQSYAARLALYRDFFWDSLTNVVGEGIGATGLATKFNNDGEQGLAFDSGVLDLMFVLGWPGTILYLGGLVWLLSVAFSAPAQRKDLAAQAAGAAVLAILAQSLSYNTLIGLPGSVFWTFLGLMLSARVFDREAAVSRAYQTGALDDIRH